MQKFISLSVACLWFFLGVLLTSCYTHKPIPKTVFIIVDGIPADVIEKLDPPALKDIANVGGYTRAYVGGGKNTYSETPTISAVGYNSLLTGTWVNKHNVWDNDIAAPNYHYWNIFRIAENTDPEITTAIFSTWLDNRTKLIGEGLNQAGGIMLDHKVDGLELDTVNYPHDDSTKYIHAIDEIISDSAARYISDKGPDLTWVYLEYTDDVGHQRGDSPQFHKAIMIADQQVDKIWKAVQHRQKEFNEDWLIVITTDHGRDPVTGKNHGGQSDRERSTWIVTNSKNLNDRFRRSPGIVDIMPSIANHMNIAIPGQLQPEIDGVPFIGAIDFAGVAATRSGNKIQLSWKSFTEDKDAKVEIFISNTNNFKEGGRDEYIKMGDAHIAHEKFEIEIDSPVFQKIWLKGPHHGANVWLVE